MLFFGGETLKDFAFAMAIGLICGSYSSVAVATDVYKRQGVKQPHIKKPKWPRSAGPFFMPEGAGRPGWGGCG